MSSNDMKKADLLGLLSQVNAALSSAVDMMGKDPGAARSLLMSVLGNLDDASASSPANMAEGSPHPPMNEQQDASVSALKAVSVPSASTPSASPSSPSVTSSPSVPEKAVSVPSASAPSVTSTPTPVAKEDAAIGPSSSPTSSVPSFTPSVPGETGDAYSAAVKAQIDAQSEAIKALTATVEKLVAQAAAPVAKAQEPALDLNAIVDGISGSEDPIIAAVLANDVEKASELAESRGGLSKVMNEAVQKSLASKPFFGAQRIYSTPTPTPVINE